MSKTEDKLRANHAAGKPSLIGYFPIGYPTLEASVEAAVAMCENGVDVLELGVPYSDPVMDGPVIQEATQTALEAGFKLRQTFDAVREVAARTEVPVLVMTYWNPVVQYGVERFATDLEKAGGAGLITPDLIPDEAAEWIETAERHGLDRVFLAAPTSTPERYKRASDESKGFVYAVSTMGITGARQELDANARKVVAGVRKASDQALTCVGIGISTPEQVAEVNTYADGAIVGSAFVRAYQENGLPGLIAKVKELSGRV
ncbi:MAG: tryptophan synthase subunit alpha [Actinomycetales bacterium]|nr:tryptophan synthase subunit alpha [Actinomycetales bacterium]